MKYVMSIASCTSPRVVEDLAHLTSHVTSEHFFTVGNQLRGAKQQLRATRPGRVMAVGPPGSVDGLFDIGRGGFLKDADGIAELAGFLFSNTSPEADGTRRRR
jgi:hypothetical protein